MIWNSFFHFHSRQDAIISHGFPHKEQEDKKVVIHRLGKVAKSSFTLFLVPGLVAVVVVWASNIPNSSSSSLWYKPIFISILGVSHMLVELKMFEASFLFFAFSHLTSDGSNPRCAFVTFTQQHNSPPNVPAGRRYPL